MLHFADVGFGLGAAFGVVLLIPAWLVWRRDHPHLPPPAGSGPSARGGGPPQSATGSLDRACPSSGIHRPVGRRVFPDVVTPDRPARATLARLGF
jgi:hypothetical protein